MATFHDSGNELFGKRFLLTHLTIKRRSASTICIENDAFNGERWRIQRVNRGDIINYAAVEIIVMFVSPWCAN